MKKDNTDVTTNRRRGSWSFDEFRALKSLIAQLAAKTGNTSMHLIDGISRWKKATDIVDGKTMESWLTEKMNRNWNSIQMATRLHFKSELDGMNSGYWRRDETDWLLSYTKRLLMSDMGMMVQRESLTIPKYGEHHAFKGLSEPKGFMFRLKKYECTELSILRGRPPKVIQRKMRSFVDFFNIEMARGESPDDILGRDNDVIMANMKKRGGMGWTQNEDLRLLRAIIRVHGVALPQGEVRMEEASKEIEKRSYDACHARWVSLNEVVNREVLGLSQDVALRLGLFSLLKKLMRQRRMTREEQKEARNNFTWVQDISAITPVLDVAFRGVKIPRKVNIIRVAILEEVRGIPGRRGRLKVGKEKGYKKAAKDRGVQGELMFKIVKTLYRRNEVRRHRHSDTHILRRAAWVSAEIRDYMSHTKLKRPIVRKKRSIKVKRDKK